MEKNQLNTKYNTPKCETFNFLVEGSILAMSVIGPENFISDKSLGALEDNDIFNEIL